MEDSDETEAPIQQNEPKMPRYIDVGKISIANLITFGSQMIAIIAVIAMQIVLELPEVGLNFINTATFEPIFFVVGEILIWISVVFTIISGVVYIIQNRQFISQT